MWITIAGRVINTHHIVVLQIITQDSDPMLRIVASIPMFDPPNRYEDFFPWDDDAHALWDFMTKIAYKPRDHP